MLLLLLLLLWEKKRVNTFFRMENRIGNTYAHTPTTEIVVSNSKNNDTNIESIEHFRIKHWISVEHYTMPHTLESTTTEHKVSSMNSRIIFAVATRENEHRTCMHGWYCDHVRHQILLLWTLFFRHWAKPLFNSLLYGGPFPCVMCLCIWEKERGGGIEWPQHSKFLRDCVPLTWCISGGLCLYVLKWYFEHFIAVSCAIQSIWPVKKLILIAVSQVCITRILFH